MRIMALVKRIVLQTLKEKRTLALMMVAPLILLSLVNFLFTSNNTTKLAVGVYNGSEAFNMELKASDIKIINYQDAKNIKDKIKNDNLKAFINSTADTLYVTYENSSPSDSAQIKAKIQGALVKARIANLTEKLPQQQQGNVAIKSNYVYGDENLTYFDTLSPILIGFFVFFFVFLISGISLLKERTTKTLEKLLATPTKRSEIVAGYLLGYGLFAVLQTIVVVFFSVYVLNIKISGNIFLVLLTNILIALIALSFGLLLSTFANSEFQMMQFIPLVVVPQIFFTGILPVENMANWLQNLAHLMPLYYGSQSLQGIMNKGYVFNDIKFNLLILLVFASVFSVLNVFGLKRYRKI